MIGTGSPVAKMPVKAHSAPTTYPNPDLGYMSPYPTVVRVMIAHQYPSGMVAKVSSMKNSA